MEYWHLISSEITVWRLFKILRASVILWFLKHHLVKISGQANSDRMMVQIAAVSTCLAG